MMCTFVTMAVNAFIRRDREARHMRKMILNHAHTMTVCGGRLSGNITISAFRWYKGMTSYLNKYIEVEVIYRGEFYYPPTNKRSYDYTRLNSYCNDRIYTAKDKSLRNIKEPMTKNIKIYCIKDVVNYLRIYGIDTPSWRIGICNFKWVE